MSGFFGGWLDRILVLIMDALYAFPSFLLAIVFSFLLTDIYGGSVIAVSLSLTVIYIPQYFRVVRNTTLSAKEATYIEAARAIGARDVRIMRRYLFGNVIQSVPVLGTLNAADAILTLAGLGFLGLGIQPTEAAEWGHDLQRALADAGSGVWWTGALPGPGHRAPGDRADPGRRGPQRDPQPDAAASPAAAGRDAAARRDRRRPRRSRADMAIDLTDERRRRRTPRGR